MYKKYKRYHKNNYVVTMMTDHHRSFETGAGFGVYEHIYVAEIMLGRRLLEGEVVHHLDFNRSNNSPDNLLILQNPQHTKLHGWMAKNDIQPLPDYSERSKLGCIRCAVCEFPIVFGYMYCGPVCYSIGKTSINKPSKEILEIEVKIYPMTTLGSKYGVSDNAVRKWCVNYNIEIPIRQGSKVRVKKDIEV